MADFGFETGLVPGCNRVASAYYRRCAFFGRLGDGFCDRDRAFVEWLFLKHSHRAVPDDRLRPVDRILKYLDRFDADVETNETGIRKGDGYSFSRIQRVITVDNLMIGRQEQLDARLLGLLLDLQ